jgi:hypothetical protein
MTMVTQYDEKGKIFTQVISKEPITVSIQTSRNNIRGTIHVRQGMRVKDELNGEEQFIAVTNAVLYNDLNEEVQRCEFLVVNIDHIIWLVPDENYA